MIRIKQQSILGAEKDVTREFFPAAAVQQLELGEPGKLTILDLAYRAPVIAGQTDLFENGLQ